MFKSSNLTLWSSMQLKRNLNDGKLKIAVCNLKTILLQLLALYNKDWYLKLLQINMYVQFLTKTWVGESASSYSGCTTDAIAEINKWDKTKDFEYEKLFDELWNCLSSNQTWYKTKISQLKVMIMSALCRKIYSYLIPWSYPTCMPKLNKITMRPFGPYTHTA